MKKLIVSVAAVFVLAGCGAGENAESDSGGTVSCPVVDAADLTEISQESNAESCATSLGWAFRVGERDGESFALTADYSQQRVTVSVTNDLVTAVVIG
jgi:hypothetical protein